MITYTSATKKIAEEAFQAALFGRSGQSKAAGRPYLPFGTCDEKGNSLLHYAVRSKNLELVRFLTEAGGLDLTWANADLVTPFDLAHIQAKEHPGDLGGRGNGSWIASVCGFSHEACYRNPVVRGMYQIPALCVWEKTTTWLIPALSFFREFRCPIPEIWSTGKPLDMWRRIRTGPGSIWGR